MSSEAIPVPFHGEQFEIGFNPEFLRDGLESVEAEELVFKLITPLRPGLIEFDAPRRDRAHGTKLHAASGASDAPLAIGGRVARPRNSCAEGQNRTVDTRFFRPVLYQLSYLGAIDKCTGAQSQACAAGMVPIGHRP